MNNRDDYMSSLLKNLTFWLLLPTLLMLMGFCDCMSGFAFAKDAQLNVVSPISKDTAVLIKGEPGAKTIKVMNIGPNDLDVESITFKPSNLDAPTEANDVKVTGLVGVTLEAKRSTEITIVFPKHDQVGKYKGWLYYATHDDPSNSISFHPFNIEVTDPSSPLIPRTPAILAAGVLSLLVLFITLWMGHSAKTPIGFFQSPVGTYSASKFQIWLWTLVIIFSFVYVFLRRGAGIEFPGTIWWLLGISVGSTGSAKIITVRRLKRTAADIPADELKKSFDGYVAKLTSMLSEQGQLSLMRLQMFGWTVVTALLFIVHVIRVEELWNVPMGLLVLMGISHAGYLTDKGVIPKITLEFDKIAPESMSAATTPKSSLLIMGQNFAEGIECYLGSVQLEIDRENMLPNRLRATLPKKGLAVGTYDLSLQNPDEKVKVAADALTVT